MFCSICLSENHLNVRTGCCKNKFHKKCLIEWLRNNPLCPLCRNENIKVLTKKLEKKKLEKKKFFNWDFLKSFFGYH